MRAALIPPKGYVKTVIASDYHLMLAQVEDLEYIRFYSFLDTEHYVILDNGASEGQAVSTKDLVAKAIAYGVDEIVVPDTLKDHQDTIKKMQKFFASDAPDDLGDAMNYMFVAQGECVHEAQLSIQAAMEARPGICIGVPRHFIKTFGDEAARLKVLRWIEEEYGTDTQVHLLGTSPLWPGELYGAAKEFPWVRGVDTSMPYNYAIQHLDLADRAVNIFRPERYFTQQYMIMSDVLDRNIKTYLGWASGTEGTWS